MKHVLADKQLDDLLLKDGYVVVPFLEEKYIKELLDFFYKNHPNEIPGFYATAHSNDISFRKKMNEQIKSVFENPISHFFNSCKALGGSYVVKSKSQEERLHPHQDWSIVDETNFRSFNIWVPLIDLNQENGAIRVAAGSHLWVDNFRGPSITDHFGNDNETIWHNMQTLNMKAGEALIYDHRLFHASYANKTDQLRVATVFGIIPQEAQMFYYFGNGDAIDVYESDVDFFMEGNIQKGYEVLNKFRTINPPTLTVKALPQYLIKTNEVPEKKQEQPHENKFKNWINRLFK